MESFPKASDVGSMYFMHPSEKEPIENFWKLKKKKKHLEGDWSNLLSVTFKAPNQIF